MMPTNDSEKTQLMRLILEHIESNKEFFVKSFEKLYVKLDSMTEDHGKLKDRVLKLEMSNKTVTQKDIPAIFEKIRGNSEIAQKIIEHDKILYGDKSTGTEGIVKIVNDVKPARVGIKVVYGAIVAMFGTIILGLIKMFGKGIFDK